MKLSAKFTFTFTFIIAFFSLYGYGQGYIRYEYIPTSALKDGLGGRYGSGSMQTVSGGCDIPLSVRHNIRKQLAMWAANVHLAYSTLGHRGQAAELNPDDILNATLNITHIRPMARNWNFIVSIGGGVYAPTNEISAKSILANGGILFVHQLNKNLRLGAGVGVTNSYGVPMVMPMLYVSWQKTGRYEFTVDMSSGLKVASSVRLTPTVKVELAALEADGMSAVTNSQGKSVIYSTVMLKSYLRPSFRIGRHLEVHAGVGGNWLRGITMSERNLKGFLNALKDDKEEDSLRFGVALQTFAGCNFKF